MPNNGYDQNHANSGRDRGVCHDPELRSEWARPPDCRDLSATPERRYQPIGITTGDLAMKILAGNLMTKIAITATLVLAANLISTEAKAAGCLRIDWGSSQRAQAWVNSCGVEVGVRWNDGGHCRRGKNGYRYPCALLVPRATTGRNGRNSERFTGQVRWHECRGTIPSEQNGRAYCY